jgi:CRISPR/Cas system CSM-associated protein Csm3 (group 7 of RAMP superfamily)
MSYFLQTTLLSDTCFSSGLGFAAEVDTDIEHEPDSGLPMIRGRTLKGLLVEECALILKVLSKNGWQEAADNLFGQPGQDRSALMRVNNSYLPDELRKAAYMATDPSSSHLSAQDILHSLTDVRNQTKINRTTRAPQEHSLRSTRLALEGLVLYSRLSFAAEISDLEKALLAACALSVRRGGLNRNRGWGRLKIRIIKDNQDVSTKWVQKLTQNQGVQV